MVSLQTPLSPNGTKTIQELDHSSKKRKWELEDHHQQPPTGDDHQPSPQKIPKSEITKSFFEIELHLETPLPLEWQRCLDIQSGQIHFYNTRTHKRTSRDPRSSPERSPGHMSLELELNLPCESQRKNHANDDHLHNVMKHSGSAGGSIKSGLGDLFEDLSRENYKKTTASSGQGLKRSPSWLAVEGDQQEMVATVCTRCHMLVMLCKSSPACPNCKFIHPPDHTPPKLFNQRLSLLC